jgi:hypothetical protein
MYRKLITSCIALVAVAAAALPGSASATVLRQTTTTVGDCFIYVQAYSNGLGRDQIGCSNRHATTVDTVRLKDEVPNGTLEWVTTATYSNSFGTGSNWLTVSGGGCGYWQTVVNYFIAGIGQGVATSGTPVYGCS